MAKTDPINTSNPAGTSDRRSGDDYIRALARAVIEILQKDHYTGSSSPYNEDAAGEHAKVTLRQASKPSSVADKGFLYTKEGESGTTELFYEDEAGNEIQITRNGKFYINGAYIGGLLAPDTDDESDNSSLSLSGGGEAAVGRGANIHLYGNEHASNPGELSLCAGYSEGTTKADINAENSKVVNLLDPTGDQDAATKKYASNPSSATSKSKDTIYEAEAFGLLRITFTLTWLYNTDRYVTVKSDGSTPPTTVISKAGGYPVHSANNGEVIHFSMLVPVLAGDYYLVEDTAGITNLSITWYPFGH